MPAYEAQVASVVLPQRPKIILQNHHKIPHSNTFTHPEGKVEQAMLAGAKHALYSITMALNSNNIELRLFL